MVEASNRTEGIQLGFYSGATENEPTRLHLLGVVGREEISKLYEYKLLLASPKGALSPSELEQLLQQPCAIALGPRPGDIVHGVLRDIVHLDATRFVQARYVATLVPMVSLLSVGKRSAVYQSTTIPKLVQKVLERYGLVKEEHFEILIENEKKSPVREYIVQYQESDWDFLQRWLEREGYFYWFKHHAAGATLVIADGKEDVTKIEDPASIEYRERSNLATGGKPTVWDFRWRLARVPARVVVVDYNYRRAADRLVVDEKVHTEGFGTVFRYGEHFKNEDEGKEVAKLRSQRELVSRHTIRGATDCARFRVGHRFELLNHHVAEYDKTYLITKIVHRVGYDVERWLEEPWGASGSSSRAIESDAPAAPWSHEVKEGAAAGYSARFEAIPFDITFRPALTTPWPRIDGFLYGHVEGDGGGATAQIDAQGRYKVSLPFDVGGTEGLGASRWIRMAEPYAGVAYGMHFPLHKGAEVIVGFAGGDPDRPVILGAVPNPLTPSPVTSANATQSVIKTASGIRVELEDQQNS